ncbi:DUF1559 domain-containing protein [Novipirellula sp. SH528]|uniref:DUF1559 domain-containing protein n=1 Tax=Novipirellula sp. SH528 TaxID=3454466 RepID=UPI003FA02C38
MKNGRIGITKVELVVGVVCALILLFLLIPTINGPRPPHRRNQCSTNLKNFALAAIQHEVSRNAFPGYAISFGFYDPDNSPASWTDQEGWTATSVKHRKLGTWAVALLPWLDAQPTYEIWADDRYPVVFGGFNALPLSDGQSGLGFSAIATPNLQIFQCPSRPLDDITHGRNSYACNTGMFYRGSEATEFARSMRTANGVFNNKFPGLDAQGSPVSVGPPVRLDDIKDGHSNTILFAENLQAMPWHRAGFIEANDLKLEDQEAEIHYPETSRYVHGIVWHFEYNEGAADAPKVNPAHRINGVSERASLVDLRMTRENAGDLARPSSAHVDGVNVSMADGSTRFITDTIDYRVYQALLTPSGTESDVPQSDFVLSEGSY